MLTVIRFALALSRWAGAGLLILATVGAATTLAITILIGEVVGRTPRLMAGSVDSEFLRGFVFLVGALILVFTVDGVLSVVVGLVAMRLTYLSDVVTRRAMSATMTQSSSIAHLSSSAVQDELRRALGLANRAAWVGLIPLGELVRSRLLAVGCAVVVGLTFSWPIAGVLLATTALVEWWSARMSAMEQGKWLARTEGNRRADYAYELGMDEAAKELRVFGYAPWLRKRHRDEWLAGMRPLWRVRGAAMWRTLLVYLVHLGALAAAITWLTLQVRDGVFGLTESAVVVTALLRLVMSANGVSAAALERATSGLSALGRLPATAQLVREQAHGGEQLVSAPDPDMGGAVTAALRLGSSAQPDDPARPRTAPPGLRFDGVWFRYPGANDHVLRGLDLEIASGETVGLVGLNGAGKSTLVHLLAGAYLPTSGRILVDGKDLAQLDDTARMVWQRRLAPVTQDFLRLPLTVVENVFLAEGPDPDRLAWLATTAGIRGAVEGLPKTWDTVLDRSVTDGGELSGGQWQRLALARALYAVECGAGLIVLDEPAAALDVRSEADLVHRYMRLVTGVTSLVISHRFSVVRDTDRICVLEDGVIREQGTHEELLRLDGRYAQMFRLQAQHYVRRRDDA